MNEICDNLYRNKKYYDDMFDPKLNIDDYQEYSDYFSKAEIPEGFNWAVE